MIQKNLDWRILVRQGNAVYYRHLIDGALKWRHRSIGLKETRQWVKASKALTLSFRPSVRTYVCLSLPPSLPPSLTY